MLTSILIFIIILFNVFTTDVFIFVIIIFWHEPTNSVSWFELVICKVLLILTHLLVLGLKLVKHLVLLSISIVFEHLLLNDLHLLIFELINELLLISSSHLFFQIVLIKLVFKIIYVYEFLNVYCIKTF